MAMPAPAVAPEALPVALPLAVLEAVRFTCPLALTELLPVTLVTEVLGRNSEDPPSTAAAAGEVAMMALKEAGVTPDLALIAIWLPLTEALFTVTEAAAQWVVGKPQYSEGPPAKVAPALSATLPVVVTEAPAATVVDSPAV